MSRHRRGGVVTRTERSLYRGAERHWPGCGDDLVVVYRAYAPEDREGALWAAATLSSLLQSTAARASCLEALRRRLPVSTRRGGPKAARRAAAMEAIDRLFGRLA